VQLLSVLRHITRYGIGIIVISSLLISGCGGGGGESPPVAPSVEWVKVENVSTYPSSAVLSGTAWISKNWVGLHCYGIGCLFDTSTDNYPGVDVTYANLTTGAIGKATSYYGGGTSWEHEWVATVPIASGKNTIQISAYDPSNEGGSITVDATGGVVSVLATVPAAGETGIPADSIISAKINSDIDPHSITSSSFVVIGPSGPLVGSLAVDGSKVEFTPSFNLVCNTTYSATLKAAIKDVGGYSLPSDYTWTFMTGCSLHRALHGVWGISSFNVFAVGDLGTIMHYNGGSWTIMDAGTSSNLYGVWGGSASDVFVVGDGGTILHYNGSSWTSMNSGTSANLHGIWGSGGSNVFVAGDSSGINSTILYYNGSYWTNVIYPGYYDHLNGIWGGSPNDIFFVGDYADSTTYRGVTLRSYAGIWNVLPFPYITSSIPKGIWGSSSTNVFTVGNGAIEHYNGGTWTSMPLPAASYIVCSYDNLGQQTCNDQPVSKYFGVWGNSGTNVFAVGESGAILHYDGNAWTINRAPSYGSANLSGIWGSSSSDIFVVGDSGTILHYNGSAWTVLP
jgi:hypothetical protein